MHIIYVLLPYSDTERHGAGTRMTPGYTPQHHRSVSDGNCATPPRAAVATIIIVLGDNRCIYSQDSHPPSISPLDNDITPYYDLMVYI